MGFSRFAERSDSSNAFYFHEVKASHVCTRRQFEQQRIVGSRRSFAASATATANAEKNLHPARAIFRESRPSSLRATREGMDEKAIGES